MTRIDDNSSLARANQCVMVAQKRFQYVPLGLLVVPATQRWTQQVQHASIDVVAWIKVSQLQLRTNIICPFATHAAALNGAIIRQIFSDVTRQLHPTLDKRCEPRILKVVQQPNKHTELFICILPHCLTVCGLWRQVCARIPDCLYSTRAYFAPVVPVHRPCVWGLPYPLLWSPISSIPEMLAYRTLHGLSQCNELEGLSRKRLRNINSIRMSGLMSVDQTSARRAEDH